MSEAVATVVVGIAALWVVIGVALSVFAARRVAQADAVLEAARTLSTLLEAAPARPVLVRADGSVEIDKRLARELGLAPDVGRLDDMAPGKAGLDAEDIAALREAVAGAAV